MEMTGSQYPVTLEVKKQVSEHKNTALLLIIQPFLHERSVGATSLDHVSKTRETIIADQDRGLDTLYDIIVRQKNIAQNIESEVDTQNDVLNDIEYGLDRTSQHLLDTTRTVQR